MTMGALLLMVGVSWPQSPFTEEAAERGLNFLFGAALTGYGMALYDLDGDGDLDVVLTGGACKRCSRGSRSTRATATMRAASRR